MKSYVLLLWFRQTPPFDQCYTSIQRSFLRIQRNSDLSGSISVRTVWFLDLYLTQTMFALNILTSWSQLGQVHVCRVYHEEKYIPILKLQLYQNSLQISFMKIEFEQFMPLFLAKAICVDVCAYWNLQLLRVQFLAVHEFSFIQPLLKLFKRLHLSLDLW